MVKLIQTLFLLYLAHLTSGWVRFRYPLSRRNYLQQTAMEMLQNCAGNPEELCGVCGEGPNELPTELISTKDFQVVNSTEGPLEVGLGFRRGMQGYFEMRLCKIGPNSVVNADDCRKVAPLQIFGDYRYLPGSQQNSARIQVSLPAEVACERCVLQVKYIPGADTRLAGQLFFDCALLRIPPNSNTLRLSGRIFMSSGPAMDRVSVTSESTDRSALPSSNDTSGIDSRGVGLAPIDTPLTESYNTTDLKLSAMRIITTTTPPLTEVSSNTARDVLETGRNSLAYKNIFTSEIRTSDLQADGIIPLGNELKQGTVSEPKVYLRQLVDTTPREVVERTDKVDTTTRDIYNSTDAISEQVTTGSVPAISTLLNLNESAVTDIINPVNDTVFSQTTETSTEMISETTLNLMNITQTDSYFMLNNQTTDQIIFAGTQSTSTDTSNQTSATTEKATLGSESTNTVHTLNDTFTTAGTTVVNWTDPYDMYGTNNRPGVPGDYYYDYYTYSEVPENKTNIPLDNSTYSSNEYFNETITYTYNMTTTEGFANTTFSYTSNPLINANDTMGSSETYTMFPYHNDSTMASLDYITDNFTLDIGSTYPLSDVTNESVSTILQTTQDVFADFTTEKSIELVTDRSSLKPPIPTGITTTTAVTPVDVNITTNEVILNDTVTTIDQTITSTVGKPDQQIVKVSNTLFDTVLFPTPRPNQDIVKVPEQITVFPSRYSVPVPTRTTVQRISTPSGSTSNDSLFVDVQQTENITTLSESETNIPLVGTVTNMKPMTQHSTVGIARGFSDVFTTEITLPPLTITEQFQQEVTLQNKVSSLDETTVHGSTDLRGQQPKTTIINIPAQDFQTSSESVNTVIDTTSFDKASHSIITKTPDDTIGLDLSMVTISPHGTITDKRYQSDSTSQTYENFVTNVTFQTFTDISGGNLLDKTNTASFSDQPISSQGTPKADTGISEAGTVIVTNPIIYTTDRTRLSTPDIKLFDPNAKTDVLAKDNFYTSTVASPVQRSTLFTTSPGTRMTITDKQTEAIEQSTKTEQAQTPITMQSSTNTPDSLGSNVNQVNTAGQSMDSVSYLPDINGLVDGIGGIPIQPGMFIDIFIPKFRVDSDGNEIILEELNSTKLLSDGTPAGKDKGTMDVLIEGLNNRERLSNDLKSATQIRTRPRKINYMTFPNNVKLNDTSFGQFRQLTLPTTFTFKDQVKTNNKESSTDTFVNQFSNFIPNFDQSQRNKEFFTRTNSADIFINSLEAPDVMPPIIVPKKPFSENSKTIGKSRSVFISTKSNANPERQRSTTERQGIASNTIWKGPGVGISGQSFGLISGPRDSETPNRNTEGFDSFFGVTGPVYIPINEISIPWKDADSSKRGPKSEISPNQVSKSNEINTTFSTLWDLNRLNKNISKEPRLSSFDGQISDQLMPPYIGIPLVWSSNPADDRQMQGTTSPNQKNWNDLPVPDIMPPIKVRLLNLTSQGTFVNNEAGLNKTDDMNRRILRKLEAIVGELQRNRALLTQTLDVNPTLEPGLQLSFDRFPTQFTGLNPDSRNPTGVFSFGGPRRKLLSEVLQDPVEKVPIVEAQNVLNAKVINPDHLVDPRGNLPISEVNIGSSIGTAKLLNMLGITDTRPLENANRIIDFKLNETEQHMESVAGESNSSQTLINTDSIGTETYPLFSATLRALTSKMSIGDLQNISEISSVLNTTHENQTLHRREHVTNASTFSSINITTTATQDVKMVSTEQIIVDAQNINSSTTQTTTNQQPFVTSSNQVIIVPTGSELTNPFEGTNITLSEQTTVGPINENITKVSTERVTPPMLHDVTTSGQRIVLATETITAVNNLKLRNNFQRNMTAAEREKDRMVRNDFNNRVLGIKSNPRRKTAETGKYNLGGMSGKRVRNLRPISVDKDFFLNELNVITKDQTPNKLNMETKRTPSNKLNSIRKDRNIGDSNVIAENRQSFSQLNFSNLPKMQLSEFSVAPPINGKIITVSEVPRESLMMKNQMFRKDYIVNSNAAGYLSNTGVLQINNVEKVATATKNPHDFTELNAMADSIRRINQEGQIKSVVEKPFTETNHVINIGQEQTIPVEHLTTPSIGKTEDYNVPYRRQFESTLSVSQIAPKFICPEGQSFICKAVGDYSSVPGMKWWCFSHCKNGMELCPDEKCRCTCEMDFQSSRKKSSIPISDVKVREKKVINLTLNGSQEARITVPIQVEPLGQYDGLTSPGRLVDTKYEPFLSQNNPEDNSASVQEINQPGLTQSKSNSVATNRRVRKKRCIGINAFAGKPEIDRWCTRMCNRNVCPPELCACKDIKRPINSDNSAI